MSKTHTVKAIKSELQKINNVIDQKIIKGISYAREAHQHKALLSQLSRLSSSGWFGKAVTTFLF